jgi:hypothetical protein
MRIQADQNIVGYPALRVRQLLRETDGRPITLRHVKEILKCSDFSARQVMRKLEAEGFAESMQGHLEPSTKGNALAMATAMPPLRRETADRLVSDVVDRARAVNRDAKWAYRIAVVVIFGSCVRGAERPNERGYRVRLSSAIQGRRTTVKRAAQERRSGSGFPKHGTVGLLAETGSAAVSERTVSWTLSPRT